MSSIVAIVGKPNVGKSTLFNRLTETKDAIVDETAGVTRDRHYGKGDWNGVVYNLIDTGGFSMGSDDSFEEEIRKQIKIAIDEADAIIFVVDVTMGITDYDEAVADLLRRVNKKVMLVVNKVDNNARIAEAGVFYALGLKELFCISSINGSGTGEMLDHLISILPPKPEDPEEEIPKIAIVGRPNVGKSSFINALLGHERNIVTPIAGTTRDAIHTRYKAFGNDFWLIDTAGLRKKGKVHEDLEFYSTMRTIKSIENADVCILLLDARDGIESQDINIFSLAVRNHRGLVIMVNKWDLVENKETNSIKQFTEAIHARIAPFRDVPIIFGSALEKQRLLKVIETAVKVYEQRKIKIPTRQLNDILLPIIEHTPPPSVKGKYLKIKYITQIKTAYPSFVFFCNHPQYFKDAYKRFLENQLREKFDFTGVPIEIYFRQK